YLQLPFWNVPCGEPVTDNVITGVSEQEIEASLERIKNQHQNALSDYLHHDYEYLYENVKVGPKEHQFIPNWVPGKKEVRIVKSLNDTDRSSQMLDTRRRLILSVIIGHLPKLHVDLQKFSVAIDQMIQDEPTVRIGEALKKTKIYLQMMLCEIESSIANFGDLEIPERISRDIMSAEERAPNDETIRLVRDWGVMLKYKNYLHAWKHVFDH
ncbi:GSCOCG00013668001-RA-CDS, partial [Cotesia congregata]